MFVPNTKKEGNNYAHAIKVALDMFSTGVALNDPLDYYVVTASDLKRSTDYASATNVVNGLNKLLTAMKLDHKALTGKEDGTTVAAIGNANYDAEIAALLSEDTDADADSDTNES